MAPTPLFVAHAHLLAPAHRYRIGRDLPGLAASFTAATLPHEERRALPAA